MNWFLKKESGEIYGPVDFITLQLWAADSRVVATDLISDDRKQWRKAADVPELGLSWVVVLRDGSEFGPVHLLVLREMLQEGTVSSRSRVRHVQTQRELTVGELLSAVFSWIAQPESVLSAEKGASGTTDAGRERLKAELQKQSSRCAELEQECRKWKAEYEKLKESSEAKKSVESAREETQKLEAQLANLRMQLENLQKTLEEERALARRKEEDLKKQIHELKSQLESAQQLRRQAEKYKAMYERAQAGASARSGEQAAASAESDSLRAQVAELERKLAQAQRSYQQLLQLVQRRLAPGAGHPPTTDQLRHSQVK